MTLNELRRNKGLTQQVFADRLNVKRSTVAMWETGKSFPSVLKISEISKVLCVDEVSLLNCFSISPASQKEIEDDKIKMHKKVKGPYTN